MPEGDVVARVANRLGKALISQPLTVAELRWPGVNPTALAGQTITEVASYGKHLFHRTSEGWSLHTHLRMDGSWRIERSGTPQADRLVRRPTTRAILANADWTTAGVDLGMLDVLRTRDESRILQGLGPDVLGPNIDPIGVEQVLERAAEHSSSPVCEILLNQRIAAGIGTIYTAESLFTRKIWPWTPIRDLLSDNPHDNELRAIYLTARSLMQRVVTGGFNARINHVHGRRSQPCHDCGAPIRRGEAGTAPYARPIFYCERCQPPPPSA